MAELYQKIESMRNTALDICKTYQTAVTGMVSGSFQCTAGTVLSASQTQLYQYMTKMDAALCLGYLHAAKIKKQKASLTAKKYKASSTQKVSNIKKIDYDTVTNYISQVKKKQKTLETLITQVPLLIREAQALQYTPSSSGPLTGLPSLGGALQSAAAAVQTQEKKEFEAARTGISDALSAAKQQMMQLFQMTAKLVTDGERVINAFVAADQTVNKKIADYSRNAALARSRSIGSVNKDNRDDAMQAREELTAAQKEYVAAYGHESEEISEEIARLNEELKSAVLESVILQATKWASQGGERGKTASDYHITGQWCDYFVLYMLRKAGLEDVANQMGRGCANQIQNIKKKDLGQWIPKSEIDSYQPKTGDLVYFGPSEGKASHVGIIHVKENGEIWVLHGNWGGGGGSEYQVCYQRWDDPNLIQVSTGGASGKNLKEITVGIASIT